jgi:hypothetical protein
MLSTSRSSYEWSPSTNNDGMERTTSHGAILCRHRLDPEVPEHSVNPCLVLGTRNAALVVRRGFD